MSKAEPFDAEAVYGDLAEQSDWLANADDLTRPAVIAALRAAYSRGRADMASECVRDYAREK